MREQPAAKRGHESHPLRPLRRNRNVACGHYLGRSAVAGVGCRVVGCSGCRAGCSGCRRLGVFARPRATELEVARRITTPRPALRRHGQSCGQLVGEIGEISPEQPMLVGYSGFYPLSRDEFYPLSTRGQRFYPRSTRRQE